MDGTATVSASGPLAARVLLGALAGVALACGSRASPADAVPAPGDDPARPAAFAADERREEREQMVVTTLIARDIDDPRVLDAMRAVPRHAFVPADVAPWAYDDRPLPIGFDQTISQPYIVAFMTQAAEVAPGDRVLEVGTGSGYQAAVLATITPHVSSIEIVEPLAARAAADLRRHGYGSVVVRAGDGYRGWPEHAPFDAIVVTAAPDHVPPALFEQLAPGGRLVIPVGAEHGLQHLRRITKDADGGRREETILPVRFVPMTGEARDGR